MCHPTLSATSPSAVQAVLSLQKLFSTGAQNLISTCGQRTTDKTAEASFDNVPSEIERLEGDLPELQSGEEIKSNAEQSAGGPALGKNEAFVAGYVWTLDQLQSEAKDWKDLLRSRGLPSRGVRELAMIRRKMLGRLYAAKSEGRAPAWFEERCKRIQAARAMARTLSASLPSAQSALPATPVTCQKTQLMEGVTMHVPVGAASVKSPAADHSNSPTGKDRAVAATTAAPVAEQTQSSKEAHLASMRSVLRLLLHSESCKQGGGQSPSCTVRGCAETKGLLRHMVRCTNHSKCSTPFCTQYRALIIHYHKCQGKNNCAVCAAPKREADAVKAKATRGTEARVLPVVREEDENKGMNVDAQQAATAEASTFRPKKERILAAHMTSTRNPPEEIKFITVATTEPGGPNSPVRVKREHEQCEHADEMETVGEDGRAAEMSTGCSSSKRVRLCEADASEEALDAVVNGRRRAIMHKGKVIQMTLVK